MPSDPLQSLTANDGSLNTNEIYRASTVLTTPKTATSSITPTALSIPSITPISINHNPTTQKHAILNRSNLPTDARKEEQYQSPKGEIDIYQFARVTAPLCSSSLQDRFKCKFAKEALSTLVLKTLVVH